MARKPNEVKEAKRRAKRRARTPEPLAKWGRRTSDAAIRWIESYCRLPEGSPGHPAGSPVKLTREQKRWIRRIFDTPTRLYILSVGRKNAKTAFLAMVFLLFIAGPYPFSIPNSQIYSAAQSREQAALLFSYMAKMIRMSPDLDAYIAIKDSTKVIVCPELGTVYRALSAEASTAYGLNPRAAAHDELGQVVGPTSPLYDAIETAMGAQEAPISIIISTQAATDADLLSTLIDDALLAHDPTIKVDLYTAPLDLDPFSEKAIRAANPHFGVFMNREEVRKQAALAKRMPAKEASYRNLVLNQRVSLHTALIPRAVWEACAGEIDEEVFLRRPTYIGIDLSARNDLTAMVAVAEDENGLIHIKPWFWTPEEGLRDRAHRDRVPYERWVADGHMIATPGVTVDYAFVAHEFAEFCSRAKVVECAFDRWRMDLFKAELSKTGFRTRDSYDDLDGGVVMAKFGQGYVDMAPAVDEIEAVFAANIARHGGNPVLRWQSWNTIVTKNASGDRKIDKSKTTARIDGMVAAVMAIRRLRAAVKPGKSFWEKEAA